MKDNTWLKSMMGQDSANITPLKRVIYDPALCWSKKKKWSSIVVAIHYIPSDTYINKILPYLLHTFLTHSFETGNPENPKEYTLVFEII